LATFKARNIDKVVDEINYRGYGLTFGLHTRIDDRVEQIVERIHAGNIYVNRNQIGAIVGSQPFGGEGLSGTGPKAGGQHYLRRFRRVGKTDVATEPRGENVERLDVETALEKIDSRNWYARLDRVSILRAALRGRTGVVRKALSETAAFDMTQQTLPGPTGERNLLRMFPRGMVLCLGPTPAIADAQALQALGAGCGALIVVPGTAPSVAGDLAAAGAPVAFLDGTIDPAILINLEGFAVVSAAGASDWTRKLRIALSQRKGAILSLITETIAPERYVLERHLCVDTTAAGGNASLLATTS
jgi:RHH-type proline utilization regulon transcriptional repressor/proline dehydrogenase/delta 1-pyrroline-5-carboxylate dehydrogenase